MDSCVSETTSNASDDFTARDEFLGKNRSLRPSDINEFDSESEEDEADSESEDEAHSESEEDESDSESEDEAHSESEDEAEAEVCLDHIVWSKLPEELLIHIFARLPVKNILQIRTLSKSWRFTITSSQFQQAFSEASLVRISLLSENDGCDGTIFFSQENMCLKVLPLSH